MTSLDVDFCRAQFPQFRDAESAKLAFFENAGGAYAPDQVIGKLQHFFQRTKVQPYYPYQASVQGGEAMDESYSRLASAINASPNELQLGPSTTMNIYVLAQALSETWTTNDEVIVTSQDHEANIGAWMRLEGRGITVKTWECDRTTGALHLQDLKRLLTDKTRMVCVTHCSNVVACVNPIKDIVGLAHDSGALALVDGVSFAPHGVVDVKDLGVDVYVFSLYKTFGPHLGLMYVHQDLLQQLSNQGHFFNAGDPKKRLTPAGPDHGEIACASGIIDYFDELHAHHFEGSGGLSVLDRIKDVFELFHVHEAQLVAPLMEQLRSKPGVRLIGDLDTDRAPTVAFTHSSIANQEIVEKLATHDVGAGYGHFYAHRLMERLGIDPEAGVTRLSMAHYNTVNEVGRAIEALDAILS